MWPNALVVIVISIVALALHLYRISPKRRVLKDTEKANKYGELQEAPHDQLQPEVIEEQKRLYHQLQHLESYPDSLGSARRLLLSYLREGLLVERYNAPRRSILHIKDYNQHALDEFLAAESQDVFDDWEQYTKRRANGSPLELYRSREHAIAWLRSYAPLNLIDGAWLAHVHKITTPFVLRSITRHAWQTLSEELGDGDLAKNHIHIYKQLLQNLGVQLPPTDSYQFLDDSNGMDDPFIWKAALAQLLISLFPNDFVPEILGFNLHFERLSVQTLKASKELPELGIPGNYYALHISIDNGHSGHSAMAVAIVHQYMQYVRNTNPEQLSTAWARVQSGYLMSQSLDNKGTLASYEAKVANILGSKAHLSRQIHCASRVRIGKQSLADWLTTHNQVNRDKWNTDFLVALANARPWIVKGDSQRSRLVRELSWQGKMFGAFTTSEVQLLRTWIDSLGPENEQDETRYWRMVGVSGHGDEHLTPKKSDLAYDYPVLEGLPLIPETPSDASVFTARSPLGTSKTDVRAWLPLWFTHACILENFVTSPYRTANAITSCVVEILHAELGYERDVNGVAGMDEQSRTAPNMDLVAIGLDIMKVHSLPEPACLRDVLDLTNPLAPESVALSYKLLGWSMQHEQGRDFLLGVARGFLDLEEAILASDGLLSAQFRYGLRRIVERKRECFDQLLSLLEADGIELDRFVHGYAVAREDLEKIFASQ